MRTVEVDAKDLATLIAYAGEAPIGSVAAAARDRLEAALQRFCDAEILVKDDRWGGVTNACDREFNHGGEHSTALNACEPVARMVWSDEPTDAKANR